MTLHGTTARRTPLIARSVGVVAGLAIALSTLTPVTAVAADTPASQTQSAASQQPQPVSARTAGRRTVRLPLTDAAWTSRPQPRRVLRSSPVLALSKGRSEAYVKFDAGALEGRSFETAHLRLFLKRGHLRPRSLVVQQTSAEWTSRSISHSKHPRVMRTHLNSRTRAARSGHWVDIRLVRTPRNVGRGDLALRVTLARRVGLATFARKGSKAPRLMVVTTPSGPVTTPPPTGPTDPTPQVDGKVFAHYFPPYPVSLDNRATKDDYYSVNYLTENGEGGKHAAYAGLLRDRPIGRTPMTGDWYLPDMRTEVREAKSGGLDGFTVDILTLSGRNWDLVGVLMKAADLEGDFTIVPMLDATALTGATPAQIAASLTTLFAHPSAQQIGRDYVLSSFAAEHRSIAWWTELLHELESVRGIPIKLISTFVGGSNALIEEFKDVSYGVGTWGTRNAANALAKPNFAAKAHAEGLVYMEAVAVQDARPSSSIYAEAGNTETLRATWARAIDDGADMVQVTTWNDYSESTSIAPSMAHGSVFLELTKHYADWFRTGVEPAITADHLYLTHRTHMWNADPSNGIKNMQPTLAGSTVAPRDTAEALVFLTAPATVTLTSGDHTITKPLPAGLSPVLVPLGVGTTSASITRGSTVVKTVTSPYPVVATPERQDLQYFAAGS